MIDPFTLITGIAGLISLAIEVTKITSDFARNVKGASGQVHDLLTELVALKDVLQRFDTFLKTQDSSGSFADNCALVSTERYCSVKIKQLYEKLTRLTEGGKLRRGLHALAWPYKQTENAELVLSLHRCAQTFQLALTVDQCKVMSQTMDVVEKTLELQIQNLTAAQEIVGIANEGVASSLAVRRDAAELIKILSTASEDIRYFSNGLNKLLDGQQDDRHKQILRWLTASSPSEKHNDAQKQRIENSGQWIFQTDSFKEWADQPGSLLWIHGIPGCGKTIVCSTIVEHFRRRVPKMAGSLLVYFYFDFSDQTNNKHKAEGFLRSVLKQLSLQTLYAPVISLYEEHSNGNVIASERSLRETLRLVLPNVPALYFVVDALDECIERNEIIDLIILLKSWGSANIHILVSSRQEPEIKEGLLGAQPLEIDITQKMIHRDVELFIDERISRSQRLDRWCKKADVNQKLRSTLLRGANGMFRWVSCHLDRLEKCVTLAALYHALSNLPPGLDKTYERILLSVDPDHKPLVTRVMQWLLFSRCPLTIGAVAEALALSKFEGQEGLDDEIGSNELSDPSEILYMCSSLVKPVYRPHLRRNGLQESFFGVDSSDMLLDASAFDQANPRDKDDRYRTHSTSIDGEATCFLQLAHASVKDYLLSPSSIIVSGTSGFALSSNLVLAETCIAYLLQFSFWGALKESIHHDKPLALYAARFWSTHARQSIGCSEWKTLEQKCKQLLCPPKEEYFNWLRLRKPNISETFDRYPAPICLMAEAGLTPIVEQLLNDGADPNGLGDEGRTSLYIAAIQGNMEIVKVLLAKGASLRAIGYDYSLFDEGQTPLAAAASKGHFAIMRSLIAAEEGKLDHKEDRLYLGGALYTAAENGHKDCALLLLENGADLKARYGRHGTAAHAAVSSHHFELIPHFIKHDASIVGLTNRRNKNVLDLAVQKRSLVTSRLLLQAGADVEGLYDSSQYSIHKDPGTPLCQAASIGNLPLVNILLDYGASINRRAGSYGSALGSAVARGRWDVARHLLDMGANPNAASGPLGTALSSAVSAGETAMVRLIVEKGVKIGEDSRAFAVAASQGDLQMLKLLMSYRESSVGTSSHSKAYASALQSACKHGNLDAARVLLDLGLDPNIGGISVAYHGNYSTPLEAAACNGNLPVARLLIEKGADINKRGLNHTALSGAVKAKDEPMVAFLLQNGAHDASLLPVAVENRSKAIVKQLLDYDVDVNAKTHRGYTALHWAAEHGDMDIVTLLLQYKADTSIRLKDPYRSLQATAFHLAVEKGHIDSAFAILAVQGRSTVNDPDSNGNTALHIAARAGQSDMVDALLALAETARITNHEGETALHMIALSDNRSYKPVGWEQFGPIPGLLEVGPAKEQEEPVQNPGVRVVTSLMAFYDHVDIQDKHGVTPLMRLAGCRLGKEFGFWPRVSDWKVLKGDEQIIDCMIDHGARFDQRDLSGKTLLHYAAILGCEYRVRWLLERKDWRNIDCGDNDGRTPLSWACMEKNQAVLRLLLGQEVDCNGADNDDWTPLERAAAQRDESTMQLLFAAGARCRKHLLLKTFPKWDDCRGYSNELAKTQECQCLRTAISHEADPSVKDEYAKSLLHYAARRDNMAATKLLLEDRYLDINVRDHQGRLALHIAAQSASSKLVEYLLENGSRASARDLRGRTSLHRASDDNYETLLKHGASLDTRDNKGRTPLHHLCTRSTDLALETVQILLSRRECLSAKDDHGLMPLDLALRQRVLNRLAQGEDARVAMLRLLMDSISDARDWTDTGRGSRLIWHFACGGYAKEISKMIEKGGGIHAINENWRTPLHQAACCYSFDSNKSEETVATLIAHGADVNSPDKERRTPLHLAAHEGNNATVRLLLEHGSIIDYRDRKRRTPLHLAALCGNEEMVQILLDAGADPCLQDYKRQTPWDLAAQRNRKGVMAMLAVASSGSTPDPDSNAMPVSENSESCVYSDMEGSHSRNSSDVDSDILPRSLDQTPPKPSSDPIETLSLCEFESDSEDDEETDGRQTLRRNSI